MKKMVGIISAFVVISVVPAYAINVSQRWDKTYDVGSLSLAFSNQQTLDGGYIVAGTEFFTGFLVLKLDYNGVVTWDKFYEGTGTALSIQQTFDGGYIVAGRSYLYPSGALVLKLDKYGYSTWQKSYAQLSNASIIQTPDGGFVMTGFRSGLVVIKLDNNGNILWQKKYSTSSIEPYPEFTFPFKRTTDGGYIVSAYDGVDVLLLKLDNSGNISWSKTYGGESGDIAFSIEETSDGGFILAGTSYSFGAGEDDLWVFKLDSSGEVTWQKTYGGESWELATSIKQTPDGGYIVVGSSSSFGGSDNLWVLKLDSSGDVTWQKIYLERRSGNHPTVGLTPDGGYIISSASSNPPTNAWKIWVLKLDNNGVIPGCEVLSTTDAIVSDTTISAEDRNVIVSPANIPATIQDITPQNTSSNISSICQYNDPLDTDGDGVENNLEEPLTSSMSNNSFLADEDNCSEAPNGLFLGTCTKGTIGSTCIADAACGVGGICSMNQEDMDDDGKGDVCDNTTMCKGLSDYDNDVDGTDATMFKSHFGRSVLV